MKIDHPEEEEDDDDDKIKDGNDNFFEMVESYNNNDKSDSYFELSNEEETRLLIDYEASNTKINEIDNKVGEIEKRIEKDNIEMKSKINSFESAIKELRDNYFEMKALITDSETSSNNFKVGSKIKIFNSDDTSDDNNKALSQQESTPLLITTIIPPETLPGQKLQVKSPTGEIIEVIVPAGSIAGQSITVSY